MIKKFESSVSAKHVENLKHPGNSLRLGAHYLKRMLAQCEGNLVYALASYNAGAHRVKQYSGIPPYRETRDYVDRVLTYYRGYHREIGSPQR